MSKPFDVEIDCGSATPVRLSLDEARIRAGGSRVQGALGDDTGDPDDRTRLWRGALTIARAIIEQSAEGTIEVYDGPDVWLIPAGSVRWVRLHDPEWSGVVRTGLRRVEDDPPAE